MTIFRHAIHSTLIIVLALLAGDGPGSAASGREINGDVNATLGLMYNLTLEGSKISRIDR
jgi:hypothetical protein